MPDTIRALDTKACLPFVSNVECWVQTTGIAPTFTDSTFGAGGAKGCASPIWIPAPMTVSKLYVLNGTVVSGNVEMYLVNGHNEYDPWPELMTNGRTTIVAQAGTSVWQQHSLSSPLQLGAGMYLIGITCSDPSTARFLSLAASLGAGYDDLYNVGMPVYTISAFPVYDSLDIVQDLTHIPCMAVGSI